MNFCLSLCFDHIEIITTKIYCLCKPIKKYLFCTNDGCCLKTCMMQSLNNKSALTPYVRRIYGQYAASLTFVANKVIPISLLLQTASYNQNEIRGSDITDKFSIPSIVEQNDWRVYRKSAGNLTSLRATRFLTITNYYWKCN